jgi:hypothetical protein
VVYGVNCLFGVSILPGSLFFLFQGSLRSLFKGESFSAKLYVHPTMTDRRRSGTSSTEVIDLTPDPTPKLCTPATELIDLTGDSDTEGLASDKVG